MIMRKWKRYLFLLTFFALVALLLTNSPAKAMTYFYVDPDANSSNIGTSSNPWTSAPKWSILNTALKSDDVTVYYSARAASSDVDQINTSGMTFNRDEKNNHHPSGVLNRLTFDGMTMYNTNDSSPSWTTYSGSARHKISANNPADFGGSVNFVHYITIRGFKFESLENQAFNWFGGDHVIIEYNEMYMKPGEPINTGPGFHLQYASDEGANASTSCTPSMTGGIHQNCGVVDFTLQYNTIHDTEGEGVYIGGWSDTDLFGSPPYSHDGVNIIGNTIYNAGIRGGQGDSLDIKPGIKDLVVRGNTIYNDDPNQPGTGDGIVTMSTGLFENNFVYNINDRCLGFGVFWAQNEAAKMRSGGIVRNNILVNCGAVGGGRNYGIEVASNGTFGTDFFSNMQIYNNTIYKTGSVGISIENKSQNISVMNNIVSKTSGIADSGISTILTHNYVGDSPGFIAIPTPPYSPFLFKISPASINTFNTGIQPTSSTISQDFFGTMRPQDGLWDIGADEYGAPPNAPSGLTIIQ